MGLLPRGVTIIHFDDCYYNQKLLMEVPHDDIDLRMFKHVHMFCDDSSLNEIRLKLKHRNNRGITFIGSGNYHYVSYLLLEEINEPFSLILFDHHHDLGIFHEYPIDLISCGSWVLHSLNDFPNLKQVLILGVGDGLNDQNYLHKTKLITSTNLPYYSTNHLLSLIPTENVYVSIDKDVLSVKDAETNWDHGNMKIEDLQKILVELFQHKTILGIDICGEYCPKVDEIFTRRFHSIVRKNEKANITILNTFLPVKEIVL